MNIYTLVIEQASRDEADIAAKLTLMAYKDLSYEIFGTSNDEKVLEYYASLWRLENSRFSYRYSHIAKVDEKPVGLMTCYGAALTKKLVSPTVKHMIKLRGMGIIWHIATHINYFYRFATTIEAQPDEFYIGTLAVLPEYRGYGIGAKLLEHMMGLAKEQGFDKCTLLVEASNNAGIRFYERNDFKKIFHAAKPREYFRVLNLF